MDAVVVQGNLVPVIRLPRSDDPERERVILLLEDVSRQIGQASAGVFGCRENRVAVSNERRAVLAMLG